MLGSNAVLRKVVESLPFDLGGGIAFGLEEAKKALFEDDSLHSRLFGAASPQPTPPTDETKNKKRRSFEHLTAIVELMNATINIHNKTSNGASDDNKRLILTGDYFSASALRLISELTEPRLRALIHKCIANACMGNILSYAGPTSPRPSSLRDHKKTAHLRQGGLFQLSFVLPFFLPGEQKPSNKALRLRQRGSLAFAWLYRLSEEPNNQNNPNNDEDSVDKWSLGQALGRQNNQLDALRTQAKSDFVRKALQSGLQRPELFLKFLPKAK